MIKWIFFDIDDTLYDQCQPFARAFQEIFPDRKDMDTEALYRRNCVYTEKVFEQIQAGIMDQILQRAQDIDLHEILSLLRN